MGSEIIVVVARGRTVRHDGTDHRPGSELRLSPADATLLIERGFVHRPGEAPNVEVVVPMTSTPEGMTAIGRVSAHDALSADRGRHFVRR